MLRQKNYHNCKFIKNQVDDLLHQMSILFQNLGTDSTPEEIRKAYEQENRLIDKIAELDSNKAQSIRPYAS